MHTNKINLQKEWEKGHLLPQRGVVLYSFKTTLMRILGLIPCVKDWKLNCGMVQLHVCAHMCIHVKVCTCICGAFLLV